MSADILLTHFNQLFCPNDLGHPLYGKEMAEAQILSDAYIAIKDGKILAVGTGQPEPELIDDHTEVKSCEGKVATPGLIDCHTHLVYGGSREHEFAKKLAGVSYAMENASPALLQVADQVAPHHKDQGVLTILEDYLGLY